MGEVLLEDVHLCPVGVGSDGVRGGAVLADVVGLDVGGMEAVKGLDGGGDSSGWLVGKFLSRLGGISCRI